MSSSIHIKVCGNKLPENISEVANLNIDMMGFIFYHNSKRNIPRNVDSTMINLTKEIKRVGVFVNESIPEIMEVDREFNLDFVQLHGDESLDFCEDLSTKIQSKIIKVFRIGETFDFNETNEFQRIASYFLFDTKTALYGGSGKKFDWKKLQDYKGEIPFILSGGIREEDFEDIKKIQNPQFIGIDLNSGFEIKPGQKDIEKLTEFINKIKN